MSLRYTRIICGIGLLLTTSQALGQYDLSWHTIDGGGGMHSTGGGFELSGTIGQPDASATILAGGDFALSGGFWPGAIESFCPGDLDNDGDVDLTDLAGLLANYGQTGGMGHEDGDLDSDGDVDLADLAALLAAYGTTCE